MKNPEEYLSELITIPSVNPEHSGSDFVKGEAEVADWLTNCLDSMGFRTERLESRPGRPSILGRFGPEKPCFSLCIEGHLDTVSVEGMTIDPFRPRLENGRMYGRGACDTKGPIASALAAFTPDRLDRLKQRGIELVFAGAMGEERGNLGALEMENSGFRCDGAIILEPTRLLPVIAHKGALWLRCTLHGRTGHASQPERGANAIEAAARYISALRNYVESCSDQTDPLLGCATMSVGRISGGTAINVVAGTCVLELDQRSIPGADLETMKTASEKLLNPLVDQGFLTSYSVEVIGHVPPFYSHAKADFIQQVQGILEEEDLPSELTGTPWYSDAGVFCRMAPAVLVFGPGDIAQAHTEDEWIEIQSLRRATDILAAFLDRFDGGKA